MGRMSGVVGRRGSVRTWGGRRAIVGLGAALCVLTLAATPALANPQPSSASLANPQPSSASLAKPQASLPIYRDTHYSFAERAADLVSRMTLAEKVAQLHTNSAPAIPRLGLQQYTYWSEGQHGVNVLGAGGVWAAKATSFPTNFASSMSWDPSLMYGIPA